MEDIQKRNEQEQDEFEQSQVILSPGQLIIKRFLRNKLATVGLAIITAMILFCFIGPFFSPYGEYEIFYINKSTGEEISMQSSHISDKGVTVNIKAPISSKHWLGTDADARDVITRLMYGGRISLTVGFVVVLVELIIGITLGGIAGYYGGRVDMIIMRLVEIFYSIPFIPIMLIISAIMAGYDGFSPRYKIYIIMFVMGILYWAGVARMVRGQILSLREMEYMQATEATGIRTSRKILKHLVPNVMPIIIIIATMDLGGIILTESVLSYLGVGISFPYASWGNMVNAVNNTVILKNFMNIWVPPGISILLTVLAFNFIGDGLRDAYDPKMKRQVGSMAMNGKEKIERLKKIKKLNNIKYKEYEKANRRKNIPESEYITKMKNPANVIEFDDLKAYFYTDMGTVKAVDGVSFDIPTGKTIGVVGESGCGKSVTSLSLMRLLQGPQGQIAGGEIRYNQTTKNRVVDIAKISKQEMEKIRGNEIAMIFQEPMTTLNPVFTVGFQIDESIKHHNPKMPKTEVKTRTIEMLNLVGIARAEGIYDSYPHELSGGMRQRVVIAMALSCNPQLIIADEPTTALDVTIQAQILDLLRDLKDKINASIMLITHDLGVVAEMADYVVVMYAGRIVEQGTAREIYHEPMHPYTIGLMKSRPILNQELERLYSIPGNVPNPINLPEHCYFKNRCEKCMEKCNGAYPRMIEVTKTHKVNCYLYESITASRAGGVYHGK